MSEGIDKLMIMVDNESTTAVESSPSERSFNRFDELIRAVYTEFEKSNEVEKKIVERSVDVARETHAIPRITSGILALVATTIFSLLQHFQGSPALDVFVEHFTAESRPMEVRAHIERVNAAAVELNRLQVELQRIAGEKGLEAARLGQMSAIGLPDEQLMRAMLAKATEFHDFASRVRDAAQSTRAAGENLLAAHPQSAEEFQPLRERADLIFQHARVASDEAVALDAALTSQATLKVATLILIASIVFWCAFILAWIREKSDSTWLRFLSSEAGTIMIMSRLRDKYKDTVFSRLQIEATMSDKGRGVLKHAVLGRHLNPTLISSIANFWIQRMLHRGVISKAGIESGSDAFVFSNDS